MNRRRFIELSAATVGAGAVLAGCTADEGVEKTKASETNTEEEPAEDEPEEEKPEPEGGDGEPFYHYDLDVREVRERGQPVWIDQHGRMYGRDDSSVVISDDWWQTTETLYTFDEAKGNVQMVIVPDSGRVIACVGGRGEAGGTVELLDRDYNDAQTLYQFDYGRVSNSLGHVASGNVVVISTYKLSDYEANRHANEVILSTDGGRSFRQVLEVPLETTDAANLHIHDVEWDPYAERIWVLVGDHGNSQLYWSDDHGRSWSEIGPRGEIPMLTQVAAFKNCIVFGSDGAPDGILRWERDGPDDEPDGVGAIDRPHVEVQTDLDGMAMYARRRWHIREDLDEGRELCLMPLAFSPMREEATDSVVLASVDGDEWYELHRTETREILMTNVMGPLSMDGDRRTLVSDSNQGGGHQIDATVPKFWE